MLAFERIRTGIGYLAPKPDAPIQILFSGSSAPQPTQAVGHVTYRTTCSNQAPTAQIRQILIDNSIRFYLGISTRASPMPVSPAFVCLDQGQPPPVAGHA